MDAPYNNPQTLVFARMKHNTCVMRGRSLHRRLLQARQSAGFYDNGTAAVHNGVAVLPSIDEPRHSRQNSRDSNRSARQQPLVVQAPPTIPSQPSSSSSTTQPGSVGKNIEIYATLPKKKGKKAAEMLREAEATTSSSTLGRNNEPPAGERQGRSVVAGFAGAMMRRERAKSEERNKSKPVPIPSVAVTAQDDLDVMNGGDGSSDNSSRSPGKKQHRIRRRLLMGGLIKRKNRSLPDLRADDDEGHEDQQQATEPEEDEPSIPPPSATTEDASNPNLEKSKLMRRSFLSNVGRNLQQVPAPNKVPPPPPVRKTSHLTPAPTQYDNYAESQITVRADIHHERTHSDLGAAVTQHDPLPPYPVVEHVRQASDDFPPPPPPQELQLLSCDPSSESTKEEEEEEQIEPSGLLAALQRKRKEILGTGTAPAPVAPAATNTSSNQWLRELQNTLQNKKMATTAPLPSVAQQEQENVNKSVRKLASRFEQVRLSPVTSCDVVDHAPRVQPQPVCPPALQKAPLASLPPPVPVGILDRKRRSGDGQTKKKSVTFCDQVILVSTAEDTEQDETYVPNPILQRVLRSAYQQEMVKDGQRQETSAPPPLVSPNFTNGTDEVDRPSLAMRNQPPPYQKLPVNSQIFQQQSQPLHYVQPQQPNYPQQQYQQPSQPPMMRNGYGVPPSPMMGQRIGPPPNAGAPPSYAPPPQYPHHARGRFQPQTAPINNNNNNNPTMKPNYPQQPHPLDQSRPPQMVQSGSWQPQQAPVQSTNMNGFTPCSLCGKKQVPSNYQYCSDCQFYMQRFQPKVWLAGTSIICLLYYQIWFIA